MLHTKTFILAVFIAACGAKSVAPNISAPATLLIKNGQVFGTDGATAVLMAGDTIAAVGQDADLMSRAGTATVIDAHGGHIVPGFHDAHIHLQSGGASLAQVQLADLTTLSAAQDAVRAYAKAHPEQAWIQGRGWQYGIAKSGKFPTRQELDAAESVRPVWLRSYDGHTGWANTKALTLAGLLQNAKDPEGGHIDREANGKTAAGALHENAMDLMYDVIPKPSTAERDVALKAALEYCLALGVTSVDDIPADADELELLAAMEARGELPLRVTVSPPLEGDLALYARLREQYTGKYVRFGFLKGFVDGVVEAKTAYMLEPYEGDTTRATAILPPDKLNVLVAQAHHANFQVALHAIGDAAVHISLDAYEAAQRAEPKSLRHRIEHIEVLDLNDLRRFKDLGVVASMMPFHSQPDDSVWSKNIGPKRLPQTFAFRTLSGAGATLAFGSDWPVMSANPLWGLATAVTRQDAEGQPPGGYNGQETITMEQAMLAYSTGSAFAVHRDDVLGRIAPGQLADVVVLDPNVKLADPKTLWTGKPALVVVGGIPRLGK